MIESTNAATMIAGALARPAVDYRAAHAPRGTPPKRHDNMRVVEMPDGQRLRVTRGQRKQIGRLRTAAKIIQMRQADAVVMRHVHPRSVRAAYAYAIETAKAEDKAGRKVKAAMAKAAAE